MNGFDNSFNKKNTEEVIREVVKSVLKARNITLEDARKVCNAVMDKAKSQGLKIVVAIYNKEGNPVLTEVMDGAYIISYEVASKKAYTCSALKISTTDFARELKVGGSLYGLNDARLSYLAGGEPLKVGDETVGGLGVSGGTASEDGALAKFGAEFFKKI